MRVRYAGIRRVRAFDTTGKKPHEKPAVRDVDSGDEIEVQGPAFLPAGLWVSVDPPRFDDNGLRLPPAWD